MEVRDIRTVDRVELRVVKTPFELFGEHAIRIALAAALIWVGALKFTAYEAMAIEPLVSNSPILSWLYGFMSVEGFSMALGVFELLLAIAILARPFAPRLTVLGGIGASVLWLITVSFILTTPGVWQEGYAFPFLSPMPGQFLAKDVVLLAAAIWVTAEALSATRRVTTAVR
ncbi:MAG: YkgB family protein [Acidimicrobiia bacterium]